MTFGETVFARRRALKLSQTDVARAIGVSVATLCKIEHDHISPKSHTAKDIIKLLQLDTPVKESGLTGNQTVDLAMLEHRLNNAIFELELILSAVRSMKEDLDEQNI